MRIAFITPNKFASWMPLNLAYLASYIRKYEDKHEFKIIDEAAGDDVKKELMEAHRELIAIAIKKLPMSLKIKKLMSNPARIFPLVLPYLYYKLKPV